MQISYPDRPADEVRKETGYEKNTTVKKNQRAQRNTKNR